MTYTADTRVVGVGPDIDAATFAAILTAAKSPAAAEAEAAYKAILACQVSPAFTLACFRHESQMGTDPQSVNQRYGTKNPGNNRSTRTGIGTVISTDRGQFVSYPSWAEGFRDMAYRLTDPAYVYAQRGLTTPAQIIPVSAPTTDGNDPTAYINAVVASMNSYGAQAQGGTIVSAPVSDIYGIPLAWMPADASNFDTSRGQVRLFIVHDEEASTAMSAVGRFQTPGQQASSHFVTDPANGRIIQCVGTVNTAWTCGNYALNQVSINVENPGFEGKPYDPKVVDYCARLGAYNAKKFNIPVVRLTKAQVKAGAAGFCGHEDIPDPNNPNLYGGTDHHTDPGATWPWDTFLALVKQYMGGTVQPQVVTPPAPVQPTPDPRRLFPQTGCYLFGGFRVRWEAIEKVLGYSAALAIFGLPLTNELSENGVTVQYFERAKFLYHPKDADPFDVVSDTLGKAAMPS